MVCLRRVETTKTPNRHFSQGDSLINRRTTERCGAQRKLLVLAIGSALAVGACANAAADFPSAVDLSGLNGTNGASLVGEATDDYAGRSIASAGDINGDGFEDLVIGAPFATSGAVFAGEAYVVFGSDQTLTSPLSLSSLTSDNGLVITGANVFDSVGYSVSSAGDINGDGIDDLVIGAPNSSLGASYAGATFVVFGRETGLPATLSVSDLDGSNGFVVLGSDTYSSSGTSVSGAGDVNGDGLDDLIIGAPYTANGSAYVVFGHDQPWNATLSVTDLNGTNGFRIVGAAEADTFGQSVSRAGDFNGDGVDDLAVGATLAGVGGVFPGRAYVVFGKHGAPTHPLNVSTLNGSNGVVLAGVNHGDSTGFALRLAGDINGDNLDDLIIGAPKADPNGDASGASFVVFGKQQAWTSPLNLADLNGTNGFVVRGVSTGDESGTSVAAAGDVNADTVDDFIIGAPKSDSNGIDAGTSYVVFGKSQAWAASLTLSSLNGTSGFRIIGASDGDLSGTAVGSTANFKAGGGSDFLIGAPKANPGNVQSGAGYVIYDASGQEADIIFANSFE